MLWATPKSPTRPATEGHLQKLRVASHQEPAIKNHPQCYNHKELRYSNKGLSLFAVLADILTATTEGPDPGTQLSHAWFLELYN